MVVRGATEGVEELLLSAACGRWWFVRFEML